VRHLHARPALSAGAGRLRFVDPMRVRERDAAKASWLRETHADSVGAGTPIK